MSISNIPCGSELITPEATGNSWQEPSNSIFLLVGPSACGKTFYCKKFFELSVNNNFLKIYVGTNFTEKKFYDFITTQDDQQKPFFINPFLNTTLVANETNEIGDNCLNATYNTIINIIKENIKTNDKNRNHRQNISYPSQICFVLDSISQLFSSFEDYKVINFLNRICLFLEEYNVTGIVTFTTIQGLSSNIYKIAPIFSGLLEMGFGEDTNSSNRKIRFSSIKNINTSNDWTNIILHNDKIKVLKENNLSCDLCNKLIYENPQFFRDLVFHEEHVDVYKKLIGIYGVKGITNMGTPGIINANFFFVDIVGLSDPSLSTRKQIEKIDLLNNLIKSCQSFYKNKDKIILPTGDGMVIAFVNNMESPFLLSKELHSELSATNKRLGDQNKLGIRIGLATGPVFIVNDINNNHNMWGPGIILARRVMDMGDDGHILIERNLAESLIKLDEKYKNSIHLIGDCSIKHGEKVTLYSAYSDDFGNSKPSLKFGKYDIVDKYLSELVEHYVTKKSS